MPQSVRPLFWLAAYLGVVLTPLAVLLLVPAPPTGGFWWDVAMGLGFAGLVMMGVQFLLTARFRRATAPFGIDVIYYFHRYLAYVIVAVVAAHPVILLVENPGTVALLNPLRAPLEITAGSAGFACLVLLVVGSAWRKKLRIPYDAWRVAHLLLAVAAVGLAFAHMWAIGYYSGTAVVRALWFVIGLSILAVVVRVRFVRPWMLRRRPYRVASVRSEPGRTWNLELVPDGHDGFGFEAGQFTWVTARNSPFAMKEHPFSIASAPSAAGGIELLIKELGDFTRTVGDLRPGERVYVDGPYGAFSIDRFPDAEGYVFVAGGIGIAPILSMLRTLCERRDRRPLVLVAAHPSWEAVPLADELDRLGEELDLRTVHVLESPEEGWEGERGWVTRDVLERAVPEAALGGREYFLCGPVPMTRAVRSTLGAMGVPQDRIHTELFDLV